MAIAAVIGLYAGNRILSSSFYYSDITEKLACSGDHALICNPTRNVINAKKSSNYSAGYVSNRKKQSVKAVKEHANIASNHSDVEPMVEMLKKLQNESCSEEDSVEVLLLLQKSMLEKQWNLSAEKTLEAFPPNEKNCKKKMQITCSGTSARRRRMDTRKRVQIPKTSAAAYSASKRLRSVVGPELQQNRLRGYMNGVVNQELLTHKEVVQLSKKIKFGLYLEEQKASLKERLGCEPSDDQLAVSLKMSLADLRSTLMECSLAREKLAMSNVRLVMSIAQRYDSMGTEMADLIQGGLIGLLRGIEKFDHSRGFKISTYVYWWIRQGVSRALVDNSRTLRLPIHLHERLSLIRNAKVKLKDSGITPSIEKIAECLNMSQKKVRNATEASSKVFSLDREAYPSLNGLPGATLHSYIADNRLENNPWHGVDGWALKDEVNNLISSTLRERERDIIRLYYGLDNECLTWEDISRRIGLSRERVRQVGLVALEKLKHAARKKQLDAMLVKH